MNIGDLVLFGGNNEGVILGSRQGRNGTLVSVERTSGSKAGTVIEVPIKDIRPVGGQARQQAYRSHPQTGRIQSQHPNRAAPPMEDYPYEEYEEVYPGHNPRSNRARQGQRWGSGAQRRDTYQRKGQRWGSQPGYSRPRHGNPLTRPVHPLVNTLVLVVMILIVISVMSLTLR